MHRDDKVNASKSPRVTRTYIVTTLTRSWNQSMTRTSLQNWTGSNEAADSRALSLTVPYELRKPSKY